MPHSQAPDDQVSDTQRMLQPQGLFSAPRPFEPQPWPGSGGSASLFAPPLPGNEDAQDGMNVTLPGGIQQLPGGGSQWGPDGGYPPGAPYPPAGQYPPGGPYPGGPYPGGPYPGGPYPGGPYPGGPYPPGRRGPLSRLPKGPLTPVIIGLVLVVVVAAAILLAQHGSSGPSGTAGGSTPGASPTATASVSALAQQQAATRLAALLPQSGADRGQVIDAAADVQSCGKNLAQDAQAFQASAANRQSLLSRLGALQGRAALPAAMVSDLTSAWQASVQVDTDLARWAQDMAGGCTRHKAADDPNLKASFGPDGQASEGKQAFTRLWNPLARQYGLKTYQVGDL